MTEILRESSRRPSIMWITYLCIENILSFTFANALRKTAVLCLVMIKSSFSETHQDVVSRVLLICILFRRQARVVVKVWLEAFHNHNRRHLEAALSEGWVSSWNLKRLSGEFRRINTVLLQGRAFQQKSASILFAVDLKTIWVKGELQVFPRFVAVISHKARLSKRPHSNTWSEGASQQLTTWWILHHFCWWTEALVIQN